MPKIVTQCITTASSSRCKVIGRENERDNHLRIEAIRSSGYKVGVRERCIIFFINHAMIARCGAKRSLKRNWILHKTKKENGDRYIDLAIVIGPDRCADMHA